jgi:hypothetical protein
MISYCSQKILIISLLVGMIVIIFNTQIDDMFGGSGPTANCTLCTSVGYNGHLTNWTLSHFLFFLILGIICPGNLNLIIFLGIAWEIVELYFEYLNKVIHNDFYCKNMPNSCHNRMTSSEFWNHYFGIKEHKFGLYWCSSGFNGQILDILSDTLGVILGAYISNNYLI